MAKITLIGAGSVEFTRMLLGDILGFQELAGSTIALHDIDAERLETADADRRATSPRGRAPPATIEAFLDRRAAARRRRLRDQHDPGRRPRGDAARPRDPARHGLRQTIGDTLGVGGVFRALRTIPVMQGSPPTWPRSAPTPGCSTTPTRWRCSAGRPTTGTPLKTLVGLCHSVQNTTEQLAALVGVPFEEITFIGAGVNHQAFILRFERDGENLYPRLDEAIERDPELRRRVRVEMYRRLGYFPTESSEHSAEYLPWFMRDDEQIERFRIPVDEYVPRSRGQPREYAATRERWRPASRCRARRPRRVRAADHPLDRDRHPAGRSTATSTTPG